MEEIELNNETKEKFDDMHYGRRPRDEEWMAAYNKVSIAFVTGKNR